MTTQETDLDFKSRKAIEKISENIHIVANDPSLAFFRIQEHVRKVLPPILDKKQEVLQLQTNLQGHCYDIDYAVSAVKGIEHSENVFKNIQEMIKTSIFLKKQLKYEEAKNKSKRDASKNSVYKRFSAHLALDLPELPDFSGVMPRMDTVMPTTSTTAGTVAVSTALSTGVTTTVAPSSGQSELQRSYTTLH